MRCNISEYHCTDPVYADESCIIEALKELGYKPVVHKEAKPLEGYHGDSRSQKANIIIPRSQVGSASNDVGFEKMPNGQYRIWISEYDQQSCFKEDVFKQNYNKHRILKTVKGKGKYKKITQKIEDNIPVIEVELR